MTSNQLENLECSSALDGQTDSVYFEMKFSEPRVTKFAQVTFFYFEMGIFFFTVFIPILFKGM